MPSDSALGLSGNARRVLLYAREEALAAGAATLTGAHILAGTLRATEVPAAAVLRAAGATLERTRTQIAASVPRSPLFRRDTSRDDLRALLQAPAGYARERGEDCIEVEHLLLGVLEDDAGAAAHTLRALGVDVESVRDALTAGLESRPA
jgi:ATP-dependent Clp protease ATP-binding subunit ClpC